MKYENRTVNVTAGVDYFHIPFKNGYTLVNVYGTTYTGVAVRSIAEDTPSGYAIFLDKAPIANSTFVVRCFWLKDTVKLLLLYIHYNRCPPTY